MMSKLEGSEALLQNFAFGTRKICILGTVH